MACLDDTEYGVPIYRNEHGLCDIQIRELNHSIKDLRDELAKLTAERDAARAACAEMSKAWKYFEDSAANGEFHGMGKCRELFNSPNPGSHLLKRMEAADRLGNESNELLSAMETCHICKGSIIIQDFPTHCEDCSGDCDDHDEPPCIPVDVAFNQVRRALAAYQAACQTKEEELK